MFTVKNLSSKIGHTESLLLLGLHMTCLVAKDLLTTFVFHLENGFRVIATFSI